MTHCHGNMTFNGDNPYTNRKLVLLDRALRRHDIIGHANSNRFDFEFYRPPAQCSSASSVARSKCTRWLEATQQSICSSCTLHLLTTITSVAINFVRVAGFKDDCGAKVPRLSMVSGTMYEANMCDGRWPPMVVNRIIVCNVLGYGRVATMRI